MLKLNRYERIDKMQFDQFEVRDFIYNYLSKKGFSSLTPIQKNVLTVLKNNQNLIAKSKTGSGKTLAYLIPLLNKINLEDKSLYGVICCPTRELAQQVFEVTKEIVAFAPKKIDVRVYAGGSNRNEELRKLESKTPNIVIGTPGKILDLAKTQNALPIYQAKYFIVDEADMAFDSGFFPDLNQIYEAIQNKKTMIFSATINEGLKNSLSKYLHTKLIISMDEDLGQNLNIEHWLLPIKSKDKYTVLGEIFEIINPYLALIFANTKDRCKEVATYLKSKGYKVAEINGGLESRERKRVMKQINDLKFQYVVASDIAARGIDIEGVSHIVNFDLPSDYEFYIHRTGRTGRANMSGIAISLYDFDNEEYIKKIEKKGIHFIQKEIKKGEFVDKKVKK